MTRIGAFKTRNVRALYEPYGLMRGQYRCCVWMRSEIGEKKEKRHQNLFACLSGALVSPLQLCSKSSALFVIGRQLDFAHGMHNIKQSQDTVWCKKCMYIFSIWIQAHFFTMSTTLTKICIASDGRLYRLFTASIIFAARRNVSAPIE